MRGTRCIDAKRNSKLGGTSSVSLLPSLVDPPAFHSSVVPIDILLTRSSPRSQSAKTRSIEMAFCGLVAFVFLVLVQSRVKERSDWRATLLHIYNTKKGVAYFRNTTRVRRLSSWRVRLERLYEPTEPVRSHPVGSPATNAAEHLSVELAR